MSNKESNHQPENEEDRNEELNKQPSAPKRKRRSNNETEFSADAPAINPHELERSKVRQHDKPTNMTVRAQHGWGWLALGVSVISLFIWTILFAIAGAALGVYAIRKNSLLLGNAAILLAMFAVVFRLFMNPMI